ncbi:MAG: hypothetical protein M1546_04510 [Chloroflexi bacterium]|nr:hypothetical protein [Chloroflexota bacterium]
MSKVSVVLDEQQQAQLRMLLADRDGVEALQFLRDVIFPQVEAIRRKELRSHLEAGQR